MTCKMLSPGNGIHFSFFPFPKVKEISIGNAPEFMIPVRALFISDIHLRRGVSDQRLNALINLIAAQSADILLLGGDYGEGIDQCKRLFEAIGSIRFPLGIYAVPGNNDHYHELRNVMALSGTELLLNRTISIKANGGLLSIGGSDEPKYGSPDTRALFRDEADYRILLSHYPCEPACACDLQLSGHTHGGQINFFGLTPYHIGFEHRYGFRVYHGLHKSNGRYLLVGNGIGISRLPIRIGADPEIYMLRFEK